jgi:AcrR family transcriptional regulator
MTSPNVSHERAFKRVGRTRLAEDDAVFRAMLAVVADVGFGRLTFASVAEHVGLTPSALVQRFGTKRDLLLAFLDWFQATAQGIIGGALQTSPESPLKALQAGLVNWTKLLPAQPERLANIVALFPSLAGDPEIRSRLGHIDRLLEQAIQEVLVAAAKKGHLRASDTKLLARLLIAACRGTLMRWAVLPERTLAENLLECLDAVLSPYRGKSSA